LSLNRLRQAEAAGVDQLRDELRTVERRIGKLVEAVADGLPARLVEEELLQRRREGRRSPGP
jgi:hypothetical protein